MKYSFKFLYSILMMLVLSITTIGATYAYFAISISNNNTIMGKSATINLTLNVEKIFPTLSSENTGVLVPQLSISSSSSSPLSNALKNGCVDGNGNVVCQVYKINIQNIGGTATQIVDGAIYFYSDTALSADVNLTMPNLKWKLIESVDINVFSNSVLGTNADLVADANDDNVFANDVTMVTNSSFDYYIIIWINETKNDQVDNSTVDNIKTFYGMVEFKSYNGTGVTSTFTP